MDNVKRIFKYLIFFASGNIIFNTIYTTVKVFTINKIGGYEDYLSNWVSGFKEVFLLYVIIYFILLIINTIYKRAIINELNRKLKKGDDKNEK